MKKLLIPIAVIACASIAVLCTACQQENTESEATTAPSITIIATADESTKDETATMPKITEENATETTSAATAETEAEETEDGTTATETESKVSNIQTRLCFDKSVYLFCAFPLSRLPL